MKNFILYIILRDNLLLINIVKIYFIIALIIMLTLCYNLMLQFK